MPRLDDDRPRARSPALRARSPPSLAAGFKQLVKDARLELKVYDIDQMCRLFNLKGGAKVRARKGRRRGGDEDGRR